MRIAFYAPMKSPDHPRPSGDRRIARLLIKAMEKTGHTIELMSDLRAWEGQGNSDLQKAIAKDALTTAQKIVDEQKLRPAEQQIEMWFSYHLYHKAPDWLGPNVTEQLRIPYIVAEASYAAKQRSGQWAEGLKQVVRALLQANAIIALNPHDLPGLKQLPLTHNKIHFVQPFLDLYEMKTLSQTAAKAEMVQKHSLDPHFPWIICVAMMRDDAKLESYRLLARTLRLIDQPIKILLVGDGTSRNKVEALFSGTLSYPTHFIGQLDQGETLKALVASDIFVWPAVNEAIGMAVLEAQACGLPVVVGESGAISSIVDNRVTGLVHAPENCRKMAKDIEQLILDKPLRKQYSKAARAKVKNNHSLDAAAHSLDQILMNLFIQNRR